MEVIDGDVRRLESGRTRREVVNHLIELAEEDPAVLIGFDFAFSVPAWYLAQLGVSALALWEILAQEALTPRMREVGLRAWMRDPESPFWRTGRPANLTSSRAFRRTELEAASHGTQPKSVFQLVGGGQVGPASLYGMQALHVLESRGFSIWPFQPARPPAVIEIFPRLLTGAVVKSDPVARARYLERVPLSAGDRAIAASSEDAFDAMLSASAMAREVTTCADLEQDPSVGGTHPGTQTPPRGVAQQLT